MTYLEKENTKPIPISIDFSNREYLPTVECFNKINWTCPDG